MCLGVPAQVVSMHPDGEPWATVEVDGVRREVCTLGIDDVEVGDWVVVHVGFALVRIDEAEAAATLALLHEGLAAEGEQ